MRTTTHVKIAFPILVQCDRKDNLGLLTSKSENYSFRLQNSFTNCDNLRQRKFFNREILLNRLVTSVRDLGDRWMMIVSSLQRAAMLALQALY